MYPVVEGLAADRIPYRGLLYAGLMVDDGVPKVLEFNVRFGDPECQVLMARLRSDLVDLVEAVLDGFLVGCQPSWDPRPCAGVVMAAAGYPGTPVKGTPIQGVDALAEWKDGVVFHAGTALRDGALVTSGGRVLTVTALGDDLAAAVRRAYEGAERITFEGAHYRSDIGHRALARDRERRPHRVIAPLDQRERDRGVAEHRREGRAGHRAEPRRRRGLRRQVLSRKRERWREAVFSLCGGRQR